MTLPNSPSSEIRRLLEQHLAVRPDHLVALHPSASRDTRARFTRWAEEHDRLKTLLGMALAEEQSGWKDTQGNPVSPDPWSGRGNIHDMRSFEEKKAANAAKKKEENRSYWERKRAGREPKPTGRPRVENPSLDAIRCRARRAEKKVANG